MRHKLFLLFSVGLCTLLYEVSTWCVFRPYRARNRSVWRMRRIAFNVLRSPDVHDDVLVGLSCQFTGEKQMVRRTKQEGVWLDEQLEHEVPFEQGAPFVFDVAIGEKEFNMTVNGKPLPPYNHKVFYGTGQYICVDKNVVLKNIRVCSISVSMSSTGEHRETGLPT